MEIEKLQKTVDDWITQFAEGYWEPLAILARLTEEVGELAREINHEFGQKPKKPGEEPTDLEMELGDVLFVLTVLANSRNISLENAFQRVMEKYWKRDLNRWTKITQEEELQNE
jgi:NTP pyrophosphatase (non-canonical NTP hydrolase)